MQIKSIYLIFVSVLFSLVAALKKTTVESVELKSAGVIVPDISEYELTKEPLNIAVKLSSKPAQVAFVLKAPSGKEVSFPAAYKSSKYELTLPLSKIPKYFKAQESIEFDLIVGDFDDNLNLDTKLFDLNVSQALQKKTAYEPSLRYGPLPEIHHIFRDAQPFVNPVVPVVFIVGVLVLFLGLLKAWLGLEFKYFSLGSVDFVFAVTLVLFEAIFVRYYIDDSIFITLARVGLVAPVSVFAGSRVLRKLQVRNLNTNKKEL